MMYNLSILINIYILFGCLCLNAQSQDETRPSSGLASSSVFINYSNSIFNTPIEEYKYVKTHRGIEIYQTYRHPTNGNVNQTIFPKAMPLAVIKTNSVTKSEVIYGNYSNSIFNKPIESITIKPRASETKSNFIEKKYTEKLPTYDGGKSINYGGDSE